jgi:CBS domain containing-hemolysin-like protein
MVESAILETPIHKARMFLQKGIPGSRELVYLKEFSEKQITTLISLQNLITVVGSVVTGALAGALFGERWVFLFAMILTFFIMVLGEIIPKRLGEQYSEAIALNGAPAVLFMSRLFMPLTFVITSILKPLLRHRSSQTSEEEIAYLAKIGGAEGTINEYENEMIQKVFKLNDITAADMMTPRSFVFMLDGKSTLGEKVSDIMSCHYSRIPIYEGTPDKIVGVATQHKLLKAIADNRQGTQLKELADEPLVVPEGRLGDDLLRDFQETNSSFGIVVDGRGHVSGIVTLQDIAAELVGEIAKEEEIAPELVKRISKTEVIVHGETQVGFLNKFFNINLPNHRTVSGFLLDQIGHLPKAGKVFTFHDIEFLIEEVDHHNLIEKVRVRKPED